jgi:hypothetical protein
MIEPDLHGQPLAMQIFYQPFRQGAQVLGLGRSQIEVPPGMQGIDEAPPQSLDNEGSLGSRGPAVREEVSHLPQISPLAKKRIGYGQAQAASGMVQVMVYRQKGGEIAAVDIGTNGQCGPVREGEWSELYRRLRWHPNPWLVIFIRQNHGPENHPPEAGDRCNTPG